MSTPSIEPSIALRRAQLVVQCACELLGINTANAPAELHLPLSVADFEQELRSRFGLSHPELVFRTESTLERARLERRGLSGVPRVVLRQGAPTRARRGATGGGLEIAGLQMQAGRAGG
jgi:hypothetical protein